MPFLSFYPDFTNNIILHTFLHILKEVKLYVKGKFRLEHPPAEICTSATILSGLQKGKGWAASLAIACSISSQRRSRGSGSFRACSSAVGTVRMMLSVANSPQGAGFPCRQRLHSSLDVLPGNTYISHGTCHPLLHFPLNSKNQTWTPQNNKLLSRAPPALKHFHSISLFYLVPHLFTPHSATPLTVLPPSLHCTSLPSPYSYQPTITKASTARSPPTIYRLTQLVVWGRHCSTDGQRHGAKVATLRHDDIKKAAPEAGDWSLGPIHTASVGHHRGS